MFWFGAIRTPPNCWVPPPHQRTVVHRSLHWPVMAQGGLEHNKTCCISLSTLFFLTIFLVCLCLFLSFYFFTCIASLVMIDSPGWREAESMARVSSFLCSTRDSLFNKFCLRVLLPEGYGQDWIFFQHHFRLNSASIMFQSSAAVFRDWWSVLFLIKRRVGVEHSDVGIFVSLFSIILQIKKIRMSLYAE